MFIGLDTPLPFSAPWAVPFEVRRAWLNGGELRVAYIYELEDTSTFRYRVFNMVEALRAEPEQQISATWFTRAEFHTNQSFVDDCDVIVVCRTRYDEGIARLVERARARKVKVIFDVDDLVFDLSMVQYIMEAIGVSTTSEQNWDYWYSYIGRLRATLDLCDAAIATTQPLADRLSAATGLRCAVLPNYLNQRQTEVSKMLLDRKQSTGYQRDGWVTCGFLSGSPTHLRDLQIASPALAGAMIRHPDLRIQLVGFAELDEHLRPFANRVDRAPLQDYLNLQRLTAQCEFCVVPLAMNVFSRCKSELKFFETGIVECPIIASPIPAYQSTIVDGVNGHLALAQQWHEKVEEAYNLAVEGGADYRSITAAAYRSSTERYAWDTQGSRIASTLSTLLDQAPTVPGHARRGN
ncbi:MAG TPA: hypothetical protein VG435_17910 [Acidimicrobiales bacterium]|jgi:glycosyltransferase involved in cell wall biosynthesis|nr:hypothetical protein [Acidimicrobiales bacterium]